MKDPLSVSALAWSVWLDFWRARRVLVVYDLLFKLMEAWIMVPAVAAILAALLFRSGHVAVSNKEVLGFLLSPSGIIYGAILGIVTLGLLLVEQAGVMVIGGLNLSDRQFQWKPGLVNTLLKPLRVIELGALMLALGTLASVPFLVIGGLTYHLFLSDHDINYYLAERPPAFWIAGGIGLLLMIGAVSTGMFFYVRWALALPILVFESKFGIHALRASRDRVGKVGWLIFFYLAGWPICFGITGLAISGSYRFLAKVVLDTGGENSIALILALLLGQGGLIALHSFVFIVVQGLLTRRLYLFQSENCGLIPFVGNQSISTMEKASFTWDRKLFYLSLMVLFFAPLALWSNLSKYLSKGPLVQVTAHRGHSLAAPENTRSAVREAIRSGADFAEVDVQVTSDGVVILAHDSDWKRVAGLSRGVGELTYNEVRKLDVGSWFGPAFAGEAVPTLTEVIELAKGKIKLNIELKFYGPDRRLIREVARIVREKEFESHCLVTTFQLDAAIELKQNNPEIRTGLIVAKSLGDVSQLEVEALSVRADWLTDDLLLAARKAGKEVHVWTVNEENRMMRLMKRGVDNIITDDPDLLIRVRREWAGLTGGEQLVLVSRLLLGLKP